MIRPPAPSPIGSPLWPIASTDRKVTDDIGDCRPLAACKSGGGTRQHAGEDLPATPGTPIVAVDDGQIVRVFVGWYKGTDALLLQTDTGPVINYGEIEAGSTAALGLGPGSRVRRGQTIGAVGPFDHLHIEAYASGTRLTHQWPIGTAPPAALRDVVPYLLAAGGVRSSSGSSKPSTPSSPNAGGGGGLELALLGALLLAGSR